jgi:hypothetical protein
MTTPEPEAAYWLWAITHRVSDPPDDRLSWCGLTTTEIKKVDVGLPSDAEMVAAGIIVSTVQKIELLGHVGGVEK